ncbi:MAG: NAD(P)-dependent oxidoreductase [Balneolaceae bacterium]|nr:NAD(P)-dependent oxidoreductase [Balneolaceae bacterium]
MPVLEELAATQSDVLSLHCPLTEETHHLVDADILKLMPEHALLINTARGAVVDEAALAVALHGDIIAGAGTGCLRGRT